MSGDWTLLQTVSMLIDCQVRFSPVDFSVSARLVQQQQIVVLLALTTIPPVDMFNLVGPFFERTETVNLDAVLVDRTSAIPHGEMTTGAFSMPGSRT